MPSSRTLRRAALGLLGAIVLVVTVVAAAYALDGSRRDGRVARRVTLAGRSVGGLSRAQLQDRVGGLADEVAATDVRIRAPGGGIDTDAAAIDLRLDEAATVGNVLAVGRTGSLLDRVDDWLRSLRGSTAAEAAVTVDEASVYTVVERDDPGTRTPATEPSIAFEEGGFVAVEGKPGKGIDAADVIAALPEAVGAAIPPVVEVDRGSVKPRFELADARRVAAEADELVDEPVTVRAGGQRREVPLATLRTWMTAEPGDDQLALGVDGGTAVKDLAKLLEGAGTAPVETRFEVDSGGVQIIAGRAGTECCAPTAADAIERAVLADDPAPVDVPLRTKEPNLTVAEAQALQIKEPIGSFTTNHKGGEPRVRNIHRLADLLRGTVIEPGKTFSVNRTVGPRTKGKGFVAAPVIEEGMFSEGVGGGISQFATTLFNAAFFAGLEFGEYQSHSIYISRYPFGREATLSFPHPDLEIENPSPHGVLIWPTYTATSITVHLYSTKWAEGSQTGQSSAARGACKRVTTERTRRFVDGRTAVDRVFATYRPKEGVNC